MLDFLKVTFKLLILLAMVFLMILPFILEYVTFRRDKKKKISYKRFRIVIYTAIYIVVITILMALLSDFVTWLEGLKPIRWIVAKIGVNARVAYFTDVVAVMAMNLIIGMLYRWISKIVRIGLKKKNLLEPKKNGEFTKGQKFEQKVIKFFHTETWFFVASILKYLNIVLSAVYILVFIVYLFPAIFGADWIPYNIILRLFEAGYIYPTITMLGLWEAYFFLEGIRRVEDECPELLEEDIEEVLERKVDLEAIDAEVKKQFGDYYACDVDLSSVAQEDLMSAEHSELTMLIADAVENDQRNPQLRKEVYLDCLDRLVDGKKGVLINGSMFSGFSLYFLRYLSSVIARGDNVVFVCNTDEQIDTVYEYIQQGFSEIVSLCCKGFKSGSVDFDDPIWRVIKVSGEHSVVEEAAVDENNILVTSLSYLCSNRFESAHSKFISLIDAVVFVDTLNTVNTFNRQLAILNTRLKHLTKKNSIAAKNGSTGDMFRVRYMSRQVRYICFDDTRTPGLDKVLKNMLSVDFDSVDAMRYNTNTMVRVYNFEGKTDENGRRICPQFFNAEEEIGAMMNMAVLCLAKGATSVSVFADDIIPYENMAETIASNMGNVVIKADGERIQLNKRFYDPNKYSVIIAIDTGDNLPATLRRYVSLAGEKPALVIVFSRPYMLRDYYISDINNLWRNSQLERIPVEEGTKKDIAQRIVVKANAGGITKDEVLLLATRVPQFEEFVKKKDVNSILRAVLEVYGVPQEDRIDLYTYFEYSSSQDFDEAGKYNSEIKIFLRRRGKVFERINGRDMVVMVTGDSEIVLPMPRSRMTQNFIAGQNLVHNGNVYHIQRVDTATGRLYARLAVGGKNDEAYQYIQARDYRIEVNPDQIENVFPTKHVVFKRDEEDIKVDDIYVSVFRAPMEVVTKGYYEIDPHTLSTNSKTSEYHSINDEGNDELAMQTYRRYGEVKEPIFSSDKILSTTNLNASKSGALMMSVKICGQFGADINKTMSLAAVMMNEILRSMFPSVADSIAVCPVLHQEFTDEESCEVLKRQPQVVVSGENEYVSKTDFNLMIIEDCATDLGVVSVLMSAGDDVLNTLFSPIFSYLKWYTESEEKNDYLHYELDHAPACFDFDALYKLSKVLGDDKYDLRFVDIESVVEYEVCDFCGKRYAKGEEVTELEDGRKMCKVCADNLVGNNKKALKMHLDRAKIFLESTYGITLDEDYEFCFESTVKIVNTLKQNRNLAKSGFDIPLRSYVDEKKKVHIEYSLPSANLSELLVRELTHVWQLKHLPGLVDDLAEGHMALVAIQYLKFLNENSLASVRTTYFESASTPSGEGYRKLVSELLANPQYNNNPFKYLLGHFGIVGDDFVPQDLSIIETGNYGLPYTPQSPDRALDGNITYFFYPRLTATYQAVYDAMVEAISNHEEKFMVDSDITIADLEKISEAVSYDHPELFWYRTLTLCGGEVSLIYGASAEEVDVLQKRIDEVVPKYLEGIDDSMSAYDVAIRLHTKVISAVDYDTIALEKQKAEGGPKNDKIDYLRTICGVFLDGKAVCEGYARAMQYLLQKCGVECAEVAGYIHKENGERDGAHAWNIVKIDGDYYYLDTTWDDSSNTVQTVKVNDLGFDYFCITTEELTRTRDIELCPAEVPACNATRANYYYHNSLVLDAYDLDKLKTMAQTAAQNQLKAFTFKCRTKVLYEQAFKQLCADGTDCYDILKVASKADKKILPNTYSYSYDKNIWTITIKFKYK